MWAHSSSLLLCYSFQIPLASFVSNCIILCIPLKISAHFWSIYIKKISRVPKAEQRQAPVSALGSQPLPVRSHPCLPRSSCILQRPAHGITSFPYFSTHRVVYYRVAQMFFCILPSCFFTYFSLAWKCTSSGRGEFFSCLPCREPHCTSLTWMLLNHFHMYRHLDCSHFFFFLQQQTRLP